MKNLIFFGRLDDALQVFGALGPGEWIAGFVIAGEKPKEKFF